MPTCIDKVHTGSQKNWILNIKIKYFKYKVIKNATSFVVVTDDCCCVAAIGWTSAMEFSHAYQNIYKTKHLCDKTA